ncbi:UNVERIFIED_CONTAM: hypothetical protein NY603_30480, partial [Bacteroidetes bacterium 56_B9]
MQKPLALDSACHFLFVFSGVFNVCLPKWLLHALLIASWCTVEGRDFVKSKRKETENAAAFLVVLVRLGMP